MENKKIRGWIIRILQRAYPAGIEEENLRKQLHNLGYPITKKDYAANIEYLKDDEFIVKQTFGGNDFDEDILQNKTYKLTTKGIDLAERSIKDVGVEL